MKIKLRWFTALILMILLMIPLFDKLALILMIIPLIIKLVYDRAATLVK